MKDQLEGLVNQMVERFSPFSQLSEVRRSWHTVLLSGEALLRIPAILALLVLPWVLRRMDLLPLPLLLVVFAIVAVGVAVTGYAYMRERR